MNRLMFAAVSLALGCTAAESFSGFVSNPADGSVAIKQPTDLAGSGGAGGAGGSGGETVPGSGGSIIRLPGTGGAPDITSGSGGGAVDGSPADADSDAGSAGGAGGPDSGGASGSGGAPGSGGASGSGGAEGGTSCTDIASWSATNALDYQPGVKVRHGNPPHIFQCKQFPEGAWCQQDSYEPQGASGDWRNAWVDRGACQ